MVTVLSVDFEEEKTQIAPNVDRMPLGVSERAEPRLNADLVQATTSVVLPEKIAIDQRQPDEVWKTFCAAVVEQDACVHVRAELEANAGLVRSQGGLFDVRASRREGDRFVASEGQQGRRGRCFRLDGALSGRQNGRVTNRK